MKQILLFVLCLIACKDVPAVGVGTDSGIVTVVSPEITDVWQGLPPGIRAPGVGVSPPAPVVSHRSMEEIQAAACMGADGKWRCKGVKQTVTLASATQPVIPVSWSVPAWFVDNANVTGSASDGNPCTTSGLPCLTKGEIIYHRWGTTSPTINATQVIITYLSPDSTVNDTGIFTPTFINGGTLYHTSPLPTPSFTGTTLLVTSKAAASNLPLTSTFTTTTGAIAIKTLLVNSTHPSRAWAIRNTAGSTWLISQPLVTYTIGGAVPFTEVDTWANGDTITGYILNTVSLAKIGGISHGITATFAPSHVVYQLNLFNAATAGSTFGDTSAAFSIIESSGVNFSASGAIEQAGNSVDNSDFFSGDISGVGGPTLVSVSIIGSAAFSIHGNPINTFQDTILGHHGVFSGSNYQLGSIYMEPTTSGDIQVSGYAIMPSGAAFYSTVGALTVAGGELDIAGTGVSAFPFGGQLYLGHFGSATSGYSFATTAGLTTIHLLGWSPGSQFAGLLDAAAGASGFGGYATGGGGTICKLAAKP